MKENETLAEVFTKFMDLINQMKSHGEEISNRTIVEKVLISLPETFDPKVAITKETRDISELGVQELMASLKSYEQKLARHFEKSIESAFQSKLIVANAEYVSTALATSQAIWLRIILDNVGEKPESATELYYDNKSAIVMAKNPVYHNMIRHIALKHHFIWEAIDG
ncbi:hypothetical protein RJ640_027670 [Escallonia rubra]|uniref:Uncharacterized protein n=1 Tax=Escallonia rubra TaxID=112253 RepID=A0AA88RZU9_9ASTE|nr:hypothetical protein RJ640_027670 [Escallonia rubra]